MEGKNQTPESGETTMAFNANLPQANSPISSAELRDQFNGLKELVDQRVTTQTFDEMIQNDTACSIGGMEQLNLTVSNPPTQAEVQALVDKLNELIDCLRRG
jgi:hypothetical protein